MQSTAANPGLEALTERASHPAAFGPVTGSSPGIFLFVGCDMAGDWIKMRHDLSTDPAVITIADKTGIDEDAVVGKLHRLWSWADAQTIDGNAVGVTLSWVDRFTRVTGFGEAMLLAGWLEEVKGQNAGICFPKFHRHISESAKERALTAKRVSSHRNAKRNAPAVTDALPREEKSREEKKEDLTPYPLPKDTNDPKEPSNLCEGIAPTLDTPDFRAQWLLYLRWRIDEKGSPLGRESRRLQLEELAVLGPVRAIAAMRWSMAQGWLTIAEKGRRNEPPKQETNLERIKRISREMGKE